MKTLALVLAFAVALGLGFKLARGAQEDVVFDGDYVYDTHCANCHGEGGMGVTLFGPPLRGDAFVTQGDNQAIAKVIQMGRKYRDTHAAIPVHQGPRDG
jgi:mono/diheme cytochrome c family protein